MQNYSEPAKVSLLSRVYEAVYSDGHLFADVELLSKVINKEMFTGVLAQSDNLYTAFCTDELINDIANTIDCAIDDKFTCRSKLNRAAELALCSYISKRPTGDMLDYKYTLSIIHKMTKEPKETDTSKLHEKFRRDVAEMLNENMTKLHMYANKNNNQIGCNCIFWNERETTHMCRSRTF